MTVAQPSAAQAYHTPRLVAMLGLRWAIVRCPSRSGRPGPEGAAWPEAGAAGQTPVIRHQEPGKLAGTHT